MAEQLGEKTEAPSARRRGEARERGSVAKSVDLGAAISLIGGFVIVLLLGPMIFRAATGLMRQLLSSSPVPMDTTFDEAVDTSIRAAVAALLAMAPFLIATFFVAALSQFVQVGILLTTKPLEPKLEALNPVKGFSKLFGRRNLVKTAVNSVKLIIVGAVAVWVIISDYQEIAMLPALGALQAFGAIGALVVELLIWILVLLLIIGLADWWYQTWQHTQDLKMTKQEVKDERRSTEGDMDTRARRMRVGREMITQRLRQAVPTADVVVTNPTHFAVALRYDAETMAAPTVVAKGTDYVALRIRELAAINGVPIVEKPPLARAIYASVPVGREVSAQFYEAVAEVLAYVYRIRGRAA